MIRSCLNLSSFSRLQVLAIEQISVETTEVFMRGGETRFNVRRPRILVCVVKVPLRIYDYRDSRPTHHVGVPPEPRGILSPG